MLINQDLVFIDTQLPACVDSAKDSYKSEISDETLQRYCFCMFSFVIDGLSDDELRLLDLASKGKDEGLESEYNSFIGKAIRIGTDMKNVTHCFTKALNK